MHDKNRPKTHRNEKKYHNLHKVSKIHLFYRALWRLSMKKENNFCCKFSQEQLLEFFELFELTTCGKTD